MMADDPRDELIRAFESELDEIYVLVDFLNGMFQAGIRVTPNDATEMQRIRDGIHRLRGLLDGYRIIGGGFCSRELWNELHDARDSHSD